MPATSEPPAASPSGILDNHRRGRVGDFLRGKIRQGSDLSIVSAYFTIFAYEALRDELDAIGRLRFLFGEPRFIQSLDPSKTEEKAFGITDDRLELKNRLEQKRVARDCADWIREKVEIRSVTQAGFLHGKMYHVDNAGIEDALLGSSNFTVRGLGLATTGNNIELNLEVDKEVLKEQYECFTGTADLYVYFFERSLQLLRVGGILSFITSNKYFRAAYGEKLRTYLLHSTAPRAILDFGDTNIFTAVAYPCILVTEKVRDVARGQLPDPKLFANESRFAEFAAHADHDIPVFAWKPGPSKVEFPAIFDREAFPLSQKDLKPSGWRLESPVGMRLLERLRKSGTPLGEYCKGRFYYGIKTGYNEAFVVDRATRNRLIAEHPSSADVLKPFLRGRDVKRWRCEFAEQYLIKIESSENVTQPWSGKDEKAAEDVFAKKLPAIHAWFSEGDHREKLIKRYDQGRFFWELRSCAYWQEFEQPKIVVPAIQDHVKYAPDTNGYYSNDKTSILVPDSVPFVLGLINAQISWWITQQEFASKQGGFYEFKPMYVSKLPIPVATPEQKALCEALAGALIELHKPETAGLPERGLIVAYFEQWLNGLVYELFFPAEFRARHLHLFDETATLLPPDGKLPPARIPELFAAAQSSKLPSQLAELANIEEICIIEG